MGSATPVMVSVAAGTMVVIRRRWVPSGWLLVVIGLGFATYGWFLRFFGVACFAVGSMFLFVWAVPASPVVADLPRVRHGLTRCR